jgi:hypothetical protein
MGKVRSTIPSDDAALAQWVYRKLVNHDPMSVRETTRVKVKGRQRVTHVEGTTSVVYALNDGRTFELSVKDLTAELEQV